MAVERAVSKHLNVTNWQLAHGLIRRKLFWYVFFVVIGVQATFVLAMLGADFDPDVMVWVLPLFVPVPLAALMCFVERKRLSSFALTPWPLWFVGAAVLFGFWSGSYFLVGHLTDPARAVLLPPELERFDRFVPFEPRFVLLYLTVYPLFLLPFFYSRRRSTVIRLGIGYVFMLLVSYVVFLIKPVAFPRPTLAEEWSSFAEWILQIVYGKDPPWNCLPSTHCAVALLAALALLESGRKVGVWALATALAIGVSTFYTKQHYIVDAVAGYVLAAITYWSLWWMSKNPQNLPEKARLIVVEDSGH